MLSHIWTEKLELITISFTIGGPIVFDFVFCNLPGQADGGEEEADAGDGEGGRGEMRQPAARLRSGPEISS